MQNKTDHITWAGREKELPFSTMLLDKFKAAHIDKMEPPFTAKKLRSCDLIISEACNLRCKKCFSWKQNCSTGLSIKQCKRIVDSVSRIAEHPFEINLGGGEPLLREGIINLIRYCRKKRLKPALSTNGTLIDRALARRLAASGLARLSISLDSPQSSINDYITGVKGSTEKTLTGISNIARYWKQGLVHIHTVLMKLNVQDILGLVEWVNDHSVISGINIQALAQPFYTPHKTDWYTNEELWPDNIQEVQALLDTLIKHKEHGYKIVNSIHQLAIYKLYYQYPERFSRKFRCNLGDHNLTIASNGIVHLCPFKAALCDVNEKKLEELWFSYHAAKIRYAMYNCRRSCNNILNCFFEEENVDTFFSKVCESDTNDVSVVGSERIHDEAITEHTTGALIQRCNLRIIPFCTLPCKMCNMWRCSYERMRHFYTHGLHLNQWRWILHELAEIGDQPVHVHFSGGEPLIHRDIFKLIRFANKQGLYTMVGTSGAPLTYCGRRRLLAAEPRVIELSIDSWQPEIHDYLRGQRGIHERLMRSATWFHKQRHLSSVGIRCLITKMNIAELPAFVDHVAQDERFASIYFQAVVQPYDSEMRDDWYQCAEYRFLWPDDPHIITDVLDALIARRKKSGSKISNSIEQLALYKYYFLHPAEFQRMRCCGQDGSSITIDWLGYASYCDCIGPIGSVKDFPLADILSSTIAQERRETMKHCTARCNAIGSVTLREQPCETIERT